MTEPETNSVARPGRPLGLTLAILATTMIFTIMPLLRLGLDLLIMSRFNNLDYTMPWGGEGGTEAIFSGGNADLIDAGELALITTLGVGFLIIAIFAWRGRPAWIRFVLFWAVLSLDVIYGLLILRSLLAPPDLTQGLSSADGFVQSTQVGYLLLIMLVTLYLIWYMNRAPARAFYRGYYLPAAPTSATPVKHMEPTAEPTQP